jgi:uncharacterized protein with GYD domain
MATYLALLQFTEQGLQNLQESPIRAAAFKAAAKKAGVEVTQIFWTLGEFDGVLIFEAKDEASATSLMLSLAALGNVKPRTLRAFNSEEFSEVVAKLPKI